MRTAWRTARLVLLIGVLGAVLPMASGRASAADPVVGSGSTFAEVALDQWAADVNRDHGLSVVYSGTGSRGGLDQFQQGVVDFAASDVPYAEDEPTRRPYAYVPVVAGGTALSYNLVDPAGVRITDLQLSPRVIAEIFFGEITMWNDDRIKADNPQLAHRLPQVPTRLAVRTPGAGTTAVFTDFLSSTAPDLWHDFVQRASVATRAGGNYTLDWPVSNGVFDCRCAAYSGSSEIASWLGSSVPAAQGSIGYVETTYAIQLSLPVARVANAAGVFRLPTARNVAVALLGATQNSDGTQNLEGVFSSHRSEAYPISSYNYLVVPTADLAEGKGETLGRYLIDAVTQGQSKAAVLGYSPLPPNLVQFALDQVPLIPGAPTPPPLGDWGRFYESLEVDPGPTTSEYADATFVKGDTELRVALGEESDANGTRDLLEVELHTTECAGRYLIVTDLSADLAAADIPGVAVDARGGSASVSGVYTVSGELTITPAGRRCATPNEAATVTTPLTLDLALDVSWQDKRRSTPVEYSGADCGGAGACYYRDAVADASLESDFHGDFTRRSTTAFFFEDVYPHSTSSAAARPLEQGVAVG